MRDSNDDKAWSESQERDASALGAQCTRPLGDTDDEQANANAIDIRLPATANNREPGLARARPTHAHGRDNPQRYTPGRVALVVGVGLGAGLSALLYSQRSPNTASDVSAVSEQQPVASAEPALDQTPAEQTQPAVELTTASAPEEVAAPLESSSAPAPPSAAAPSHAGAPPAANESAHAPRPSSTIPIIKITKTAEPAPPPDSEEARLAAAAVRTGKDNPTDALLDDAFAQGQERAKQALAARNAPPAIPQVPSRDDVIKAMRDLLPAIRDCAQGQTGIVTANLVVSNDGKVQMVGIIGQAFGGTDHGRCMEGVVKSAQLPRFQQSSFHAQFPFSIQ